MVVAILGASDNPDRYAYKAFKMLQEAGHEVIPVTPAKSEIEGVPTFKDLSSINKKVDILTLYVGSSKLEKLVDDIVSLNPSFVIFNPGTESNLVEVILDKKNIKYTEGCTLVLLRTNQFNSLI